MAKLIKSRKVSGQSRSAKKQQLATSARGVKSRKVPVTGLSPSTRESTKKGTKSKAAGNGNADTAQEFLDDPGQPAAVAAEAKPKCSKEPVGKSTVIKIAPLNLGRMKLRLKGTSPLVTNNWGPKSRLQMLEKQMQAEPTKHREPRCPEEEFLQALYWVDGNPPEPHVNKETGARSYKKNEVINALKKGTFGIPAAGLHNAIISACRNTELTMAAMKQTLFVNGIEDPDWLIIKSDSLCSMDARICRLSGPARTPIERFRPMWKKWSVDIRVEWDRGMISEEQIVNLIAIAGHFVGLCEGRPERSTLGWGRFEIV